MKDFDGPDTTSSVLGYQTRNRLFGPATASSSPTQADIPTQHDDKSEVDARFSLRLVLALAAVISPR